MADESHAERLNRELDQLLQELRVVLPGVQVLLAFLLTAPFNQRFGQLAPSVRNIYFVSVCCTVMAVILLLAPSAHHRLLFREGEKEHLVQLANRLAVTGTVFLAAAITLALYVVTHVLFGDDEALVTALVAAVLFAAFWYALPFTGRSSGRGQTAGSQARPS
jgi:Family of unknown function (DUF6328)